MQIQKLDETAITQLASWRRYSIEFTRWLVEKELIAFVGESIGLPVFGTDGLVAGWHYRRQDGEWRYHPPGLKTTALVFEANRPSKLWVFESQWDAFSVMDLVKWHVEAIPEVRIVITRGASNYKLVAPYLSGCADILLFQQQDQPGERWTASIHKGVTTARILRPPPGIKDFNDWLRAGLTADALWTAIETAPGPKQTGISNPNLPSAKPNITLPSQTTQIIDCAAALFPLLAEGKTLFSRNGRVQEVATDDRGHSYLKVVSPQGFRSRMEWVANFFALRTLNGEQVLKPTVPSLDQSSALLETVHASKLLPRIVGVARCPILFATAAEARIATNGYDEQSGWYISSSVTVPEVSLETAVADLKAVIAGFDFCTPSDRSRAMAALISVALKMGGHITGKIPADVAEADQSQAGKTYRQQLTAALYGEVVTVIPQKSGGAGSDDETFNEGLVRGSPFLQFDNRRGKLSSTHLEAFLTATTNFPARVPYAGTVWVDPDSFFVCLSSNGVETTPDFANRSSIIRIRKRPRNTRFAEYPAGDILAHVRASFPHHLGCIFAIVKEWIRAGKLRTGETAHDFRDWAQSLDWIVQHICGEAPLLEGHRTAQTRVSNPASNFIRQVALLLQPQFPAEVTASDICRLALDNNVPVPGLRDSNIGTGARLIGSQLKLLLENKESFVIEEFCVTAATRRLRRTDGNGFNLQPMYVFDRLKTPPLQPQQGPLTS